MDDQNKQGDTTKVELASPVKIDTADLRETFKDAKDPVTVKVTNSSDDPMAVKVTNSSFDVKLKSNERPADEFKAVDLFGNLIGMHKRVQDNIKDVAKNKRMYSPLKQSVKSKMKEWFPNDVDKYKFVDCSDLKDSNCDLYKTLNVANKDYPFALELIYNYWLEEGFTCQTLFAITERYRNKPGKWTEKLMNLTLDPLRPVNDLLTGYIRDLRIGELLIPEERSLEYQNQYGYILSSRRNLRATDVRSEFHSAFNKLLMECSAYFKQADDNTINANAFPVLTALQDLNLILAKGDVNQAVYFARQARIEILIEQQILNRSEIGDYLRERPLIPYGADWMRRVDAMKGLQGWNPISIRVFNDLAEKGEIILLSVRFINWTAMNEAAAKAWASYFRDTIQTYIHRYNTVTGVDLSADNSKYNVFTDTRDLLPSVLIYQKMQNQIENFQKF